MTWNSYKTLQTCTYSRKLLMQQLSFKNRSQKMVILARQQEAKSAPINQCENVIEFNATQVKFYPRTQSPKRNTTSLIHFWSSYSCTFKLWGKTQFIYLFFIIPFGSTLMFRRRKRHSELHCGNKILLKFWLSFLRPGDGISAPSDLSDCLVILKQSKPRKNTKPEILTPFKESSPITCFL